MKIYTLYYKDTNLYNRSIFVMPNDEAAKKAMKVNLMDSRGENLRNDAKLGNTELVVLTQFSEETGIFVDSVYAGHLETVCNLKDLLKDLLNDNNGNLESAKSDNA